MWELSSVMTSSLKNSIYSPPPLPPQEFFYKKMERNPLKIACSCPCGRVIKKTVTQAILSPSWMHLPIYNCTYHTTPTLLSWGRLQWQPQTDVCLTRMRHNYEERVQQEFWNHSVPGRVSFRKSPLHTAVPLSDRERTTRWLISTAPLIGPDGYLPSCLSLGSHFCVRSTAVHAHTSALTDWLMQVCMHTHTHTHTHTLSLSLSHSLTHTLVNKSHKEHQIHPN